MDIFSDPILDKAKSAGIAAFAGVGTAIAVLAVALKLVASSDGASHASAFGYLIKYPVSSWHPIFYVCVAVALLVGGTASIVLWLVMKNIKWTSQPKRLDSQASAEEILEKSTPPGKPRIFGGKFGGKPFFASVEDRALVIGPPGTGKTTMLFNQILRLAREQMCFVAVDMKPELHSVLADSLKEQGYRVLKINPAIIDPDAITWDPLADIDDEIDIAEMVAALLPIDDPKAEVFRQADRNWFAAAVHTAKHLGGGLPDALELLSSNEPIALCKMILEAGPEPAKRLARQMLTGLEGPKPSAVVSGAISTVQSSLGFLALEGVKKSLSGSEFSIKEIGQKDKPPVALFLQLEEVRLQALGPVLSLYTTAILNFLISSVGSREPVALFLDELGNLPAIPGLANKLNTIRSRHMPCWMYFQSTEQINRQYGQNADQIFLGSADLLIAFRINDVKTRQLVSDLIGTTTYDKISHSKSGGKTTTSKNKETKKVIEPHVIGQLKAGQIIALYKGGSAMGHGTPHFVDFPEFRR